MGAFIYLIKFFFSELLRVIDSLQLSSKHRIATPVNWKYGETCMIQPNVKTEECDRLFSKGYKIIQVPSGLDYLRTTPQPE